MRFMRPIELATPHNPIPWTPDPRPYYPIVMQRVVIFANPIAGSGRSRALADQIEQHLRRRGYRPQVLLTRVDSGQLVIAEQDIGAAIVIGGDGTLRAVADWAIGSAVAPGEKIGTGAIFSPPLLLVPVGTANLMGRHLGIAFGDPDPAQQVVRALEHGRIVHLDVARTRGGIFLLVAGVGFDAAVVHELSRCRTGPIAKLNYIAPALRTLLSYDFPPLSIVADDRPIFGPAPALALIGNIPEYGTGFPLLPHAKPDDQLLDLCVMPCANRRQLLQLFVAAAAGQHIEQDGVVYTKARSIRIDSPRPVPVQVDGEPAGFTPLHIDLLPGRIPFIVPPRDE